MKYRLPALFLLLFATTTGFAQWAWDIHFDTPNEFTLWHLRLDSTAPNNIWQTGHTAKTVFTTAHSQPNALVTDTLNPVPANDTTAFLLVHARDTSGPFHVFTLDFWYQTDGDSTDSGIIEVSPDYGQHWINVLTEDTAYNISWNFGKPGFSGSSNGWQHTQVDMSQWSSDKFNTFPVPMNKDSVLIRFTYRTGSDTILHDGWMIDDIQVKDWWEGIDEWQLQNQVSIYPNPAGKELHLAVAETARLQGGIEIYDALGHAVYQQKMQKEFTIDISGFASGTYFLRYGDGSHTGVKQFSVQR